MNIKNYTQITHALILASNSIFYIFSNIQTLPELHNLNLKLCNQQYNKVDVVLLHLIVVLKLSGGWQHIYFTKTRQAGPANEQPMYSLKSMLKVFSCLQTFVGNFFLGTNIERSFSLASSICWELFLGCKHCWELLLDTNFSCELFLEQKYFLGTFLSPFICWELFIYSCHLLGTFSQNLERKDVITFLIKMINGIRILLLEPRLAFQRQSLDCTLNNRAQYF